VNKGSLRFFAFKKIQLNTLLIILSISFGQFQWISAMYGGWTPTEINYYSSKLPETRSEDYQEIHENDCCWILLWLKLFTPISATETFIDFTLSYNYARQFYSSIRNPPEWKGLWQTIDRSKLAISSLSWISYNAIGLGYLWCYATCGQLVL